MSTIRPTPNQAAIVLRKYLNSIGTNIPLSVAQESIARTMGYADWNTLAANIDTRAKPKDHPIRARSEIDDEADNYLRELAGVSASDWILAFENCRPQALYRHRPNEKLKRMSTQEYLEQTSALDRLTFDFYYAVTASGALSAYRHVPGAFYAQENLELVLVFERRLKNRLAIEFWAILHWDGLEVKLRSYQLLDVTGSGIVDEVAHPTIIARGSESLGSLIDRAAATADELARDLAGWINARRYVYIGKATQR